MAPLISIQFQRPSEEKHYSQSSVDLQVGRDQPAQIEADERIERATEASESMVSVRRNLQAKRARMENQGAFGVLPPELILCILTAVSASADKPADLFNVILVCKEFGRLMIHPQVLRAASAACMSVLPGRWCPAAERFIRFCGDQGNAEANYFLGMIQFYCFGLKSLGWSRMMMALWSGHAQAAFALAVIYYNRSFGDFDHRDPRAAAHLFALAARRGHMGALRDMAFCVTNGFGVRQDPAAGRRLTVTANLMELRARYPTEPELAVGYAHVVSSPGCLNSELGCFTTVPAGLRGWAHPANRFLCEWFAAHPLPFQPAHLPPPMCSFPTCGRPETRGLEYRRCHVCGIARYCSVTCQSLHWRMGHTRECVPVQQWLMETIAHANQAAVNNVDGNAAIPAAVNNATDDNDNNLGGGGDAGAGAAPM